MIRLLEHSSTWYYVAGYLYATVAPVYFLARISKLFFLILARDEGVEEVALDRYHRSDIAMLLGLVERPLYVAAWILGAPEFIGVWLALKVAGGWSGWSEGVTVPVKPGSDAKIKITGRHLLNTHLIGSALSVLNAVVGALAIQWLIAGSWPHATWLAIAALAVTGFAWGFVEWQWRKRKIPLRAA